MKTSNILAAVILILLIPISLFGVIWEIRQDGTGDFFTIQEGITASADGDTVLVYPGTYFETIDFSGKDIIVSSLQLITGDNSFIYETIIDSNRSGDVVTITNGETESAMLNGFILQKAFGRGIRIVNSSPRLKNLLIRNNQGQGISINASNSYLENITIKNNNTFFWGGGISIAGNSNLTFSSENKCNIYNNTAGFAADINIHPNQTLPVHVIVDTFTVFDHDWSLVSQTQLLELSIDNQWLQQVESDIFVSPCGDNSNSGLTPSEPLRCIQWALTKIKADSLNPRTIHLAPGIYSPAANDQLFPLNMRSYVILKGSGKDYTFLEEPIEITPNNPTSVIFGSGATDFSIMDLTIRNVVSDVMSSRDIVNMKEHLAPGVKINARFSGFRMTGCHNSGIGYNTNGNLIIEDSEFVNNSGSLIGLIGRGRDPAEYGDVYLNNLVIMDNEPYIDNGDGYSANIYIAMFNNIHISNCLIAQNVHHSTIFPTGYVVLIPYNTLTFANNIVAFNDTIGDAPGGSFVLQGPGTFNIDNSIFYDNQQYQFIIHRNSIQAATVNISYCLIEGGTGASIIHVADTNPYGVNINWGEGIIDSPPLFLGETDGGYDMSDILYYQPSFYSPQIDSGTPDITGLNLPPYDLLYNKRVWDGHGDGVAVIDIGCFEYNAPGYLSSDDHVTSIPETLKMSNYPNPFNPETTILFSLPRQEKIRLDIFNIRGQRVTTLLEDYRESGDHRVIWDGRDERGIPVSSGIYFYRIKAGEFSDRRKMILLK